MSTNDAPEGTVSTVGNDCVLALNDSGATCVLAWYVKPEEGMWWWSRWQALIEIKWPNGNYETLWKRHYRTHAKAWKRTQQRYNRWLNRNTTA
jgi:hypothetical protein